MDIKAIFLCFKIIYGNDAYEAPVTFTRKMISKYNVKIINVKEKPWNLIRKYTKMTFSAGYVLIYIRNINYIYKLFILFKKEARKKWTKEQFLKC